MKNDETKHTNGPWRISEHPNGFKLEIVAVVGIVATVAGTSNSAKETQANARLIAAAPELVEVLIGALAALHTAYAAAYCGPQSWTDEIREEYRIKACKADSEATESRGGIMSDFQLYQDLKQAMRCMIRAGQLQSDAFNDAWQQTEALKNKHGGFPPLPEDFDYEAQEQEACETANMEGRR